MADDDWGKEMDVLMNARRSGEPKPRSRRRKPKNYCGRRKNAARRTTQPNSHRPDDYVQASEPDRAIRARA